MKLLRELADGDRLVVIATHDQRLLPIADRVVELVPKTTRDFREHVGPLPVERVAAEVELVAGVPVSAR
jgi:ABC-type lipoprotein export system ATPase subunit